MQVGCAQPRGPQALGSCPSRSLCTPIPLLGGGVLGAPLPLSSIVMGFPLVSSNVASVKQSVEGCSPAHCEKDEVGPGKAQDVPGRSVMSTRL